MERQFSIRGGACSSPGNFIIFKHGLSLCRKCAKTIEKNPPKHECAQIEPKTPNMSSYNGSLAERPHPIGGGVCSSPGKYNILVGFGRACAPVRCAHLSFWSHCHYQRGSARPPAYRSFAAFTYPAKLSLRSELSRQGRITPLG